MRIPKGLVFIWSGTHANIPANWIRKTALDGRFPKAWGDVAVNTQGGNANHTHSSPSHTHSIAEHTHTGTTSACNSRDSANTENGGGISLIQHTHPFTTGAITSSNNFGSTAVTYGTMSNDPPFVEVIYIEADYGAILVDGIIALWAGWGGGTNVPSYYQLCNGSSGAPDYRNKYLKGAGTGANAGGTGGSTTNVHDITHGHTGASHVQQGFSTSGYNGHRISGGGGSCCSVVYYHTHTYTSTDAETVTPNNYTTPLTTTETVEPAYKKICAIQKKTGGIREKGLVGYWFGSEASIPRGWVMMNGQNGTIDYRNKHIKIASATSEIGDTGGSNTHTHGAQSHTHTTPQHRHYVNQSKNHQSMTLENIGSGSPGNADDVVANDTHPAFYTDYATPNTTSSSTTANSSNNEPLYTTAILIQLQYIAEGGAFLEDL